MNSITVSLFDADDNPLERTVDNLLAAIESLADELAGLTNPIEARTLILDRLATI